MEQNPPIDNWLIRSRLNWLKQTLVPPIAFKWVPPIDRNDYWGDSLSILPYV